MPMMSRPVQQRRQVEYATKADVEIPAAGIRGFREATDARLMRTAMRTTRVSAWPQTIARRSDGLSDSPWRWAV